MDMLQRLAIQRASAALQVAAGGPEPSPPGRLAARFLKSLAVARGQCATAREYIDAQNWLEREKIKAAIGAMTTGDGLAPTDVGVDFVARVWPRTILGRMAGLRRVPFFIKGVAMTGGAAGQWVAQGAAKPIRLANFTAQPALEPRKVTTASVVSEELADAPGIEAEDILLRDLENACIASMDAAFIDPGNTGVAGEQPASATDGGTLIASAGTTAAHVREDLAALFAAYQGDWDTAYLVLHPRTASAISMLQDPLGATSLQFSGPASLLGVPALISAAVPYNGTTSVSLVDAGGVWLAGGRTANLSVAREATVEMESEPTSDSATPTETEQVSLWQTNSVGLLAELPVNWAARATAAVTITDVDYSVAAEA